MSDRLTNWMRDTIIDRALKHRFDQPQAVLKKKEDALFLALYAHKFGDAVIRKMRQLPEGWLLCRDFIRVDPDPEGPDPYIRIHGIIAQPMPANDIGMLRIEELPKRLRDRVRRLHKDQGDLRDARNELRREISSLLNSFSTVARLRQVWPEGARFLPPEATQPKKQLLAVPVDDLNKKLRLAARS